MLNNKWRERTEIRPKPQKKWQCKNILIQLKQHTTYQTNESWFLSIDLLLNMFNARVPIHVLKEEKKNAHNRREKCREEKNETIIKWTIWNLRYRIKHEWTWREQQFFFTRYLWRNGCKWSTENCDTYYLRGGQDHENRKRKKKKKKTYNNNKYLWTINIVLYFHFASFVRFNVI